MKLKRCLYESTIERFLKSDANIWLNDMATNHRQLIGLPLDTSQSTAWAESYRILQDALEIVDKKHQRHHIIFEYILPYESGRRPDVIILTSQQLYIIEFKGKDAIVQADVDQLIAYARDISEYHVESRNRQIIPILVLTRSDAMSMTLGSEKSAYKINVCSKDCLGELLNFDHGDVDVDKWLDSIYEPLPTIVEAARLIMKNEPLPYIKRAHSTGIPEAIKFLHQQTLQARDNKEFILALVTGVPGSGKTLLGLQFVYDQHGLNRRLNSIFLSGNGPLIKVLSHALQSNVFVNDLHKVIGEYVMSGAQDFSKNVVVFDEGQRAWDDDRIFKRYQLQKTSEPDLMIQLMDARLDWAMLLVLVGEGQEIHTGENKGIKQWRDALTKSGKNWKILCPDKLDPFFVQDWIIEDTSRSQLDLSTTLRSHVSGHVSDFVNHLVIGDIGQAKQICQQVINEGYSLWLTRSINQAKAYCEHRYEGQDNKRYGLLASSRAKGLHQYHVYNSWNATKFTDYGKWYNSDKGSGKSSCDFRDTVTEFGCQGLELDMPIVCWGDDMLWSSSAHDWKLFDQRFPKEHEINTYRINSYRVLLSRGRDGTIIFIPDEEKYNETYKLLLNVGISILK